MVNVYVSAYIYVYLYAPLLKELYENLRMSMIEDLPTANDVASKTSDPIITPVHQLMAVMPPSSRKLIPEPWRTHTELEFRDISPYQFLTDVEGNTEKSKYQEIAIISVVDSVRLVRETNGFGNEGPLPVPKKYQYQNPNNFRNIKNPREPFVVMNLKQLAVAQEREREKAKQSLIVGEAKELVHVGPVGPSVLVEETKSTSSIGVNKKGGLSKPLPGLKSKPDISVKVPSSTSTFAWQNSYLM
jgi:hypothetical protein